MNNPASESTILIAEDDKEIRTALERILSYEGYKTVAVNDGAAALEQLDASQPDAVILDVMMPFVDGLTVCSKMRTKGDRTPVLMLTARHETSDKVAGLDAGADDYLAKPSNWKNYWPGCGHCSVEQSIQPMLSSELARWRSIRKSGRQRAAARR